MKGLALAVMTWVVVTGTLSGCTGPSQTPSVVNRPASTSTAARATEPATVAPTVAASPTGAAAKPSPMAPSPTTGRAQSTPLFLTMLSPADESETASANCLVRGRTAPGAIVSVNGALANVDARGEFTHTVVLEEGANVIEIIASDVEGAEVRNTLLLDYVP